MIPEEKNGCVTRALRETFGVTEFEDIRSIAVGLSSDLAFRIVVKGRPYLLHMLSATVFLLLGSAGKPINLGEKFPSFGDFHRRIWAGEVNLADNDLKITYGMIHWNRLLQNMRQSRFEEALRVVSDRHAGPQGMRRLLPLAQ